MFDCMFVFKRDGNGGMFADTPCICCMVCSFSQVRGSLIVQSLNHCRLLSFQENKASRCFKSRGFAPKRVALSVSRPTPNMLRFKGNDFIDQIHAICSILGTPEATAPIFIVDKRQDEM